MQISDFLKETRYKIYVIPILNFLKKLKIILNMLQQGIGLSFLWFALFYFSLLSFYLIVLNLLILDFIFIIFSLCCFKLLFS